MILVYVNEVDPLIPSENILIFPINVVFFLHDNNKSQSGNMKMEQDANIPVSKKTSNLDIHHMVARAKARSTGLCTILLTTNMDLKRDFQRQSQMEEVSKLLKHGF